MYWKKYFSQPFVKRDTTDCRCGGVRRVAIARLHSEQCVSGEPATHQHRPLHVRHPATQVSSPSHPSLRRRHDHSSLGGLGVTMDAVDCRLAVHRRMYSYIISSSSLTLYALWNYCMKCNCAIYNKYTLCLNPPPYTVYFEQLSGSEKLTNFNNFWCTQSCGYFTSENCKLTHFVWTRSPHYLVKCKKSHFQLLISISADTRTLLISRTCANFGDRAFGAAGPRVWN